MKVVIRNAKRKAKKKSGVKLIILALFALFVVMASNSISLRKEKRALEKQYSELQVKLQKEEERFDYLTERQAYMQTMSYIEEVARERLGLVYEEEIIFRPQEEN